MILKEFFKYYYSAIPEQIQNKYLDLFEIDREELIEKSIDVLTNLNILNSEQFLSFFKLRRRVHKENPNFSISFLNKTNICFDFFINLILKSMNSSLFKKIANKVDSSKFEDILKYIKNNDKKKDFFREIIRQNIPHLVFQDIYKLLSLQNFSSGGEATFLKYRNILNKKYGKILNAGCGSGLATYFLSQKNQVTSVDISPIQLKKAIILYNELNKKRSNLINPISKLMTDELMDLNINFKSINKDFESLYEPEFLIFDLSKDLLERNYYDLILCIDVLEHVQNPYKLLINLMECVKKNGALALTIQTLGTHIGQEIIEISQNLVFPVMMHINTFNLFDLYELIQKQNFKIVYIDYYNFGTFFDVILHLNRFASDKRMKNNWKKVLNSINGSNEKLVKELKAKQSLVILKRI
ncbi:MAG: class I SAM-dependent methyltransferase [Promethearchaeota archaeon]